MTCKSLGILSRGKRFRYYKVHNGCKAHIAQLIHLINPLKWKFKKRVFVELFKNNRSSLIEALS